RRRLAVRRGRAGRAARARRRAGARRLAATATATVAAARTAVRDRRADVRRGEVAAPRGAEGVGREGVEVRRLVVPRAAGDTGALRGSRRPFLRVLLPVREARLDAAEVEERLLNHRARAAVLPEEAGRLVDVDEDVQVVLARRDGALDEELADGLHR